jgi:hypothetical protein
LTDTSPIQASLFEEDYLVRTVGAIARKPDTALTELVANAWDAGASEVRISIPAALEEELVVEDDGVGMTSSQFIDRWMTLGFDRLKKLGPNAEFPLERQDWQRRAYGRNGMGRHSMLCFADEYVVETSRDDMLHRFIVAARSGETPFVLLSQKSEKGKNHGTRLSAVVKRNLPNPEQILELISARFLSDPRFKIYVNGRTVLLTEQVGFIEQREFITDGFRIRILVFDATTQARTTLHHGIAFWVAGRLVGHPAWRVGERTMLDGRIQAAKRYTIVVEADDLIDYVLPDWSAFREDDRIAGVFDVVADTVNDILRGVLATRSDDVRNEIIQEFETDIMSLPLGAQEEISEIISEMTRSQPLVHQGLLASAVKATIAAKKSRSWSALMDKLSHLDEGDVEELNRILGEWAVRDIKTVLDAIEYRLDAVHALDQLSSDSKVDELRTLHPLVARSRWLFGPEYDSPEFASNTTLQKAVEKTFRRSVPKENFENWRKRPDLLILGDSSLCAVASQEFDSNRQLPVLKHLLLIELKKGGSKINKSALRQAEDYVDEIRNCGILDGPPNIVTYIVGHEVDHQLANPTRKGDPTTMTFHLCTYSQLVRAAEVRLFCLRQELRSRYEDASPLELARKVVQRQENLPFR